MCYEWEWFQWRRSAEAKGKREQANTTAEHTPVNDPGDSTHPDAQPTLAPQPVQEELEPV